MHVLSTQAWSGHLPGKAETFLQRQQRQEEFQELLVSFRNGESTSRADSNSEKSKHISKLLSEAPNGMDMCALIEASRVVTLGSSVHIQIGIGEVRISQTSIVFVHFAAHLIY